MASFRFLHTADIHLDSPLAGLARRDRVPAHLTRDCTRRAFANVIDLAIREDVAFVVIAGDLYDDDWKDFSTGLHFAHEMRRLGRPCMIVRGNHDAASHITKQLTLPANVHEFSSHRPETFRGLDALGVAVHGRSFPNRAVPEDLSRDYPPPVPGRLNIGVLHTSADDPGPHATYSPCTAATLAARGYDYWALGHIHDRRVLHERPYVVFPGNVQGRSIRETGAKTCTLVEVEDGRIVGLSAHATDVLRWALVRVDAAGTRSRAELAERMRFALAGAERGAEGRPLVVRVVLHGATGLHGGLLGAPDALDAECRAAAAALSGDLHIETVRLDTSHPVAVPPPSGDALGQLAEAFAAALDDGPTAERLLADFRNLLSQMPRLPGQEPPDLPRSAAELRALAPEAWRMVADMLTGGA